MIFPCRFLALERAVPKDSRGRINFWHVASVVQHIVKETTEDGEPGVKNLQQKRAALDRQIQLEWVRKQ
jgi:hypothetical protein